MIYISFLNWKRKYIKESRELIAAKSRANHFELLNESRLETINKLEQRIKKLTPKRDLLTGRFIKKDKI